MKSSMLTGIPRGGKKKKKKSFAKLSLYLSISTTQESKEKAKENAAMFFQNPKHKTGEIKFKIPYKISCICSYTPLQLLKQT